MSNRNKQALPSTFSPLNEGDPLNRFDTEVSALNALQMLFERIGTTEVEGQHVAQLLEVFGRAFTERVEDWAAERDRNGAYYDHDQGKVVYRPAGARS